MAYTLSFVEFPIICCRSFTAFGAYRLYLYEQDRPWGGGGDVVINIVFAFAASTWTFTSFRHSNDCGYLSSDFAFTAWRTPVMITSMPH